MKQIHTFLFIKYIIRQSLGEKSIVHRVTLTARTNTIHNTRPLLIHSQYLCKYFGQNRLRFNIDKLTISQCNKIFASEMT